MAITSRTVVEGSRRIVMRLPIRGPGKEFLLIAISGIWCPGSPRDKYCPPFGLVFDTHFSLLPPTPILSPLAKRVSPFSSLLLSGHSPNPQQNMSESFGFQAEISQLLDLIISEFATFSVPFCCPLILILHRHLLLQQGNFFAGTDF